MGPSWALSIVLAASVLAGCGSRTGLPVPEGDRGSADCLVPDGPGCTDGGAPLGPCEAASVDVAFEQPVRLGRADVVFLVDTTGSMGGEIEALSRGIIELTDLLMEQVPDVRIAVATFRDFTDSTFAPDERPFQLWYPATDNAEAIQGVMRSIWADGGGDGYEAQVEALYQLATGEGNGRYVFPAVCPPHTVGYPCLRPDATPIVMLFTDAPFHNGRGGTHPYGNPTIQEVAHRYDDAVLALNRIHARVIGFHRIEYAWDEEVHGDLLAISTDTSADATGLVYRVNSPTSDLLDRVTAAVRVLTTPRTDIGLSIVDPHPGDDRDPADAVRSIRAWRAEPADGVEPIAPGAESFQGVQGGTRVIFRLAIDPGAHGVAHVRFHDGEGAVLGERDVELEGRCP